MKYEDFFYDNKYKMANDKIKMLINNLIKTFENKCIKKFYPAWLGDEGDTKVFVLKLQERLITQVWRHLFPNPVIARTTAPILNVVVPNN